MLPKLVLNTNIILSYIPSKTMHFILTDLCSSLLVSHYIQIIHIYLTFMGKINGISGLQCSVGLLKSFLMSFKFLIVTLRIWGLCVILFLFVCLSDFFYAQKVKRKVSRIYSMHVNYRCCECLASIKRSAPVPGILT